MQISAASQSPCLHSRKIHVKKKTVARVPVPATIILKFAVPVVLHADATSRIQKIHSH